jgi:hypothetical protein
MTEEEGRWQTSSGAHERIIKRSVNAGVYGVQVFSVPRAVEFEACRAVYAEELRTRLQQAPAAPHELHREALRLVRAAMNPEQHAGEYNNLPVRPLLEREAMRWAAGHLGLCFADVSYLLSQVDTIEERKT